MRQHLGVILGPAELLDPAGCPLVPLGPTGPRNLPIGHVPDEHVPKGILLVGANR